MMGFGVRALVTCLLALISLAVLSLHVALCFHYPSALFAVTLLLNPSLWLFVGLLSMFCTLILSLRDRRRKLVPALCTSCRPRSERLSYLTSRNKLYLHNRWYQHTVCSCSERSLLACRYSSESSVHTVTPLLSTGTNSSHAGTQIPEPSVFTKGVREKGTDSSFSSPESSSNEKKKTQSCDIQNYSCLMKATSESLGKQNTLVLLEKEGQTKNICFNKPDEPLKPENSSNLGCRQAYCSYTKEECKMYVSNRAKFAHENIYENILPYQQIGRDNISGEEISGSVSVKSEVDEKIGVHCCPKRLESKVDFHCHSSLGKVQSHYSESLIAEELPRNKSEEESNKCLPKTAARNPYSRCTCIRKQRRPYSSRLQQSNKPVMKCTNSFRAPTPFHLFQVVPCADSEDSSSSTCTSKGASPRKSSNFKSGKNRSMKLGSTSEMSREPDTISSIVSLLD